MKTSIYIHIYPYIYVLGGSSHLVSGLVYPNYKWINPLQKSHVNHWGELTHNHDSWVVRHQVCWDLSDAHRRGKIQWTHMSGRFLWVFSENFKRASNHIHDYENVKLAIDPKTRLPSKFHKTILINGNLELSLWKWKHVPFQMGQSFINYPPIFGEFPLKMTRDDRNLQATKAYRHRRCCNLGSSNRDIMGLGQVETTIH